MAVKCKNGHWYDPKMYSYCPHCKRESEQLSLTIDNVSENDKTVSIAEIDVSLGEQLGQIIRGKTDTVNDLSSGEPEEDGDKTISFGFFGMTETRPVTGWLVCTTGTERGKDYRLHSGKNFIGRGTKMDVVLVDDKTIAREKHCSVAYDPMGNEFYVSGENGNIVYLNQEIIESAHKIQSGDEIQIGETKLIFIPFCQEERIWEKE